MQQAQPVLNQGLIWNSDRHTTAFNGFESVLSCLKQGLKATIPLEKSPFFGL